MGVRLTRKKHRKIFKSLNDKGINLYTERLIGIGFLETYMEGRVNCLSISEKGGWFLSDMKDDYDLFERSIYEA